MEDQQLLKQFNEAKSQVAFARLVERHWGLVHSTCRRELGGSGLADSGLAEDAAQVVFLLLAQKANSLRHEVVLSGWLFQAARFTAKDMLKYERRRGVRDNRIGAEMVNRAEHEEEEAWREISPWLHESLARLNEKDRLAILLRFFEGMSFADVAVALGQKEDAARHRVNRALEKMRGTLASRGVTVPAAALAGLLAANAVKPASASAAFMSPISLLSDNSHLQHFTRGILQAMSMKQNLAMGVAVTLICVALGAGAGLAKNTHPVAGAPAPLAPSVAGAKKAPAPFLPAASGGLGDRVLGAWASTVPISKNQRGDIQMGDMTIHFSPDGTFTMKEWYKDVQTQRLHTLACSGTYTLADALLTTVVTRVIANGRVEPVLAEGLPRKVGKISFSRHDKTLTLDYSYFKQVLVRRKTELSAEGGLG